MDAIKDALVKCGWSHYDGDNWWKDGVIMTFGLAVARELEEAAEHSVQSDGAGVCPLCGDKLFCAMCGEHVCL